MRNAFRGFVPRRVRWLIRVALRLVSGYYIRRAFADWRELSERVVSQSAELEAQSEVMYLLVRRIRTLEGEVQRLPIALDEPLQLLAQIRERLTTCQREGSETATDIQCRLAAIEGALNSRTSVSMVAPESDPVEASVRDD